MFLVWSPPKGLVGDALVATEGAGLVSSASKKFGFPLLPALELTFPAALVSSPARPSALVFKFSPLRPLQILQPRFAPPSLARAAVLGEKLRSPLPMVVSKPF
jgi:hypothetical protein